MVRNKYIIFPFLFLVWTIIVVHSIIPHHHHTEDIFSECQQCDLHTSHLTESKEIHDCDTDCTSFTCHFQVKVLTQISIDNIFNITSENSTLNKLNSTEINSVDFYFDFISDQINQTKFLRGPPFIS